MRHLDPRTIMGWLFAIEATLFLPTALWKSVHEGRAYLGSASHGILTPFFPSMSVIVFASASLNVLKGWRSAPVWGVVASFLFVLFYFIPLTTTEHFVWWHGMGDLFFGLAGLSVFTRLSKANTAPIQDNR